MLNITAVRFSNAFVFGNESHHIDFTKAATTLVVGSNGAGKSSGTLDCLCFGLYGRAYRDISKAQIINSINDKNCLIEVDFNKNGQTYLVRRGIRPSVLEIWKNGELIPQPGDVRDYQRHLEDNILGMDLKTFKSVVVIGKADHLPFLKLNAQQRRDLVEDILDLSVFSTMRQIVKTRGDTNKATINDVEKRRIAVSTELDAERRHAEAAKADNAGRIAAIVEARMEATTHVKGWQSDIATKKAEIEDKKASIPSLIAIVTELDKYREMSSKLKYKRSDLSTKLRFYTEHENCPTCQGKIDPVEKSVHVSALNEEIAKLDRAEQKLKSMIETSQTNKEDTERSLKVIAGIQSEIDSIEALIKAEARDQMRLSNELKLLKTVVEADLERLLTLEQDLVVITEDYDRLKSEAEVISQAAILLKDNGVKARVIAKYIPIFNELINKYLEVLGLFVGFQLDENFNETIHSRGRDKFTYESFSEGEKFRIDLAVLFSWRSLSRLRNSTSANILIFDEILDSSLDVEGKTALIDMLVKSEGVHIFVISHDPETYADKFDRVLEFKKVANFSRIEERV